MERGRGKKGSVLRAGLQTRVKRQQLGLNNEREDKESEGKGGKEASQFAVRAADAGTWLRSMVSLPYEGKRRGSEGKKTTLPRLQRTPRCARTPARLPGDRGHVVVARFLRDWEERETRKEEREGLFLTWGKISSTMRGRAASGPRDSDSVNAYLDDLGKLRLQGWEGEGRGRIRLFGNKFLSSSKPRVVIPRAAEQSPESDSKKTGKRELT